MSAAPSSSLVRLARLAWPYRSPLARSADRLESLVLSLVVLAGLLLVPVMLVFGSLTHAGIEERGELQARTRTETVATLTEDAPPAIVDGHGYAVVTKFDVRAVWRLPDGATRAGVVRADGGSRAGTRVEIWLDGVGRVVDPPPTAAEAAAGGALVALFGWLTAAGLLALVQFGVHRVLNRRRLRGWDQEWARVEPGWNQFRR